MRPLIRRRKDERVEEILKDLKFGELQLNKLKRVAELRGESLEKTVSRTFRNLMSVVPASIKPRNIVTDAPVKSISHEDGLVKIVLDNERVTWNFPSRQRYANLYYTFRDLVPRFVDAASYGPYHDVAFRYLAATKTPYFPTHDGAVVIEGGAYIGIKALGYYDAIESNGKVIAIEIGGEQYRLLCRNVEANGLQGKIIPVRCGIWHEAGEMEAEFEVYASHSLRPPDEHKHYSRRETVPTNTLDNIIDEYSLEVVDYLNLQINGAEGNAIDGLQRNFDKVKIIYVGAHYTLDGAPHDQVTVKQLQDRGCTILYKTKGSIWAVTPKWAHEFEPMKGWSMDWVR